MAVMRRKSLLHCQAVRSVLLPSWRPRFRLRDCRVLAGTFYRSSVTTLIVLCLVYYPHVANGIEDDYPTARALPLSRPDHRGRSAHARRLDNRPPVSQELEGLITHPDGRILGHLLWDKPDVTKEKTKNPAKYKDQIKGRLPSRASVSHIHQTIHQQRPAVPGNGWNRKFYDLPQPSVGNSEVSSDGHMIVYSSPAPVDESDRATSPTSAIAPPYIQEADQSRVGVSPMIREHSGDRAEVLRSPTTFAPKTPYQLPVIGSAAFLDFNQEQRTQGTKERFPGWVSRDIIPRLRAGSAPYAEETTEKLDIFSTTSHHGGDSTSSTGAPVDLPDDDASLIQLLEEALDFLEDYPQYIDELDLDTLYDYLSNETDASAARDNQHGISTSQRPASETSSLEEEADDRTEEPDVDFLTTTETPSTTTAATTTGSIGTTRTRIDTTTTQDVSKPSSDTAADIVSFRPIELPRLEDLFSIKSNFVFTDAFDILSSASTTTGSLEPTSSATITSTSAAASMTTTETTITTASTTTTTSIPPMTSSTANDVMSASPSPRSLGRLENAGTVEKPRKYNPLRPTRAPNVAVLIQSSKAKTPEEIRKLVESYTNPKKLGQPADSPALEPFDDAKAVTVSSTSSSSTATASTTTTTKETPPYTSLENSTKMSSTSGVLSKEAAVGAGLVWPRGNKRGKPIFSTEAPSSTPPMSFDDFLKKFSVKEAPVPELVPPPMPKLTVETGKATRLPKAENVNRPQWTRTSFEDPPKSILDLNPWSFTGERGAASSPKPAPTSVTTTTPTTTSRSTTGASKSDQKERMLGDLMNDRSNKNFWTTRLGRPVKVNQNSGFDFDSLSSGQGGGSVLTFGKNNGADHAAAPDRTLIIDTFSEAVGPEEPEDLLQGTAVEADNAPVAASAIIVSTVIGSVAALFFISLFVFCKWRQYKQIRRNTRMPMPNFGRARSRRQSTRSYMRSPYYTSNNFWTLFGKTHHTETFHSSVSGFSDSS